MPSRVEHCRPAGGEPFRPLAVLASQADLQCQLLVLGHARHCRFEHCRQSCQLISQFCLMQQAAYDVLAQPAGSLLPPRHLRVPSSDSQCPAFQTSDRQGVLYGCLKQLCWPRGKG